MRTTGSIGTEIDLILLCVCPSAAEKVAHANRELNIEGAIRGHDVDAAVLNKSTNPGKQSKQQIKRVARAREAVDGMLKRW